MDNLMKRVRESGAVKVEEAWAFFQVYEMLMQCKKYRIMLGETAKTKRIQEILELVNNACISEAEKKSLSHFFCMHGRNGYFTDISYYTEELESRQRQSIPLYDEEKERVRYKAA